LIVLLRKVAYPSNLRRGRPVLAEGVVAERVIERVARLSQRYGTKISRRGDMGVIEL
jgi:hypothetical protein